MGKAKRKAGEPETINKEEYDKRITTGVYINPSEPKYYKNHAAIIEVAELEKQKPVKVIAPEPKWNKVKVIVTGWYPLTIQSEKIHYSTH